MNTKERFQSFYAQITATSGSSGNLSSPADEDERLNLVTLRLIENGIEHSIKVDPNELIVGATISGSSQYPMTLREWLENNPGWMVAP